MMTVPSERLELFSQMEKRYEKQDVDFFVKLLDHEDYVVRTRATRS
jgi:deoxyhypusine monooxygenase